MKKIDNIEAFVRQNAPYMTKNDMVEESGWSEVKIREICGRLGISPISQKNKIQNFILDHYKTKPISWIAKCCFFCEKHVADYYKEMGIKEPNFPKPMQPAKRGIIAERLSQARHQNSHHYHDA